MEYQDNLDKAWEALFDGDLLGAKEWLERSRNRDLNDFSILNLSGYIALEEKDFFKAASLYQTYIAQAKSRGDIEQEHIGYHQLAMILREEGRYAEALQLIEKEGELIETSFSDDALKISVNLYEKGYLSLKMGRVKEALTFMEACLSASMQTDDLIAQACAYRGLGDIYKESHEKVSARQAYLRAKTLFCDAGDRIGEEEIESLLLQVLD